MRISSGVLNGIGIKGGSSSKKAKVSLILNGIIFCKKGEFISVVEKQKKYTIFERYEEQRDSKGAKTVVGRMFKVANDLVELYFD